MFRALQELFSKKNTVVPIVDPNKNKKRKKAHAEVLTTGDKSRNMKQARSHHYSLDRYKHTYYRYAERARICHITERPQAQGSIQSRSTQKKTQKPQQHSLTALELMHIIKCEAAAKKIQEQRQKRLARNKQHHEFAFFQQSVSSKNTPWASREETAPSSTTTESHSMYLSLSQQPKRFYSEGMLGLMDSPILGSREFSQSRIDTTSGMNESASDEAASCDMSVPGFIKTF